MGPIPRNDNQAFDPFDVLDGEETADASQDQVNIGSNPWSASTWTSFDANQSSFDVAETSFEFSSHPNAFQFSAEVTPSQDDDNLNASDGFDGLSIITDNNSNKNNKDGKDGFGAAFAPEKETIFPSDPFPSDPMADVAEDVVEVESDADYKSIDQPTIRVAIREQFSTIYDDSGNTPSIEGTIHVQSTQVLDKPFCVVVKDSQRNVGELDAVLHTSAFINDKAPLNKLQVGDKVLRVTLPQNSLLEAPIASYKCVSQLRPIPMLVKSRVQVTNNLSRVGFKIRANPSNAESLNNMVILIAVPPYVQGETVKMSRKGGVWDEMKRTICWTAEKLEPGQVLEIQAQFQSENLTGRDDLKFPILVRCDSVRLFSGIEVVTDYADDTSGMVKCEVSKCSRILHRKV